MSEMLRATPVAIDQELINNLDNNMNSQATTQEQLSTGYTVNQPSDNPAVIGPVLSTNSLINRTGQYIQNANDGLSFLNQANSAMNQVSQLLDEAKSLIVQIGGPTAQMGTTSPPDQIAAQLQGIVTNMLSLMNETYLGMPIFGGTAMSGSQAFDSSGNYQGTSVPLLRTVAPGTSIQATLVGSSVFGSGATGIIGVLNKTISDIQAGNYGTVQSTDQNAFDGVNNQIQTYGTTVGALYQAMQQAQQSATQTQTVLKNQISNLIDTNVAQATTNLQQEQNTYQAALWAAAQVNKYSLIQFVS